MAGDSGPVAWGGVVGVVVPVGEEVVWVGEGEFDLVEVEAFLVQRESKGLEREEEWKKKQ